MSRLAAAGIGLCVALAVPALHMSPAAATPVNGRIAYSVGAILPDPDPGAASQVYTVNQDGTGRRQLTHVVAPVQAGDPSYSPSGTRILYVSNPTRHFQIWAMNGDGSDQHRLVNDPGHDEFLPSWSPDARTIVFTRCLSVVGTTECAIAVVNADGTGLHDITHGHWQDFVARYAPDGQHIVFSSDRAGLIAAVWRCAPDGADLRQLTDPDLEAWWPDYAPNGQRIVFTSNFDRPLGQLYTMTPNGAAVRQLTNFTDNDQGFAASYAPDGTRLVLSATNGLAVLNADGSGLTTIVPVADLIIADWGVRS